MDKRYLDHAAEVLGRLLESREDPPAFLQPADQALHDAPPAVPKPPEFTESPYDLNEGNYATIAARYGATGLTPPDSFV